MNNLWKFKGFLDHLQYEHCSPSCHHDATRCSVAKALVTARYGDFKWCPLCNSYKVGEREKILGSGKFAKKIIIWLLGGNGGLVRGFLPDGHYKAVFACRCEVGQHVRIFGKRIRPYDFDADPDSRNDCFQKCSLDLLERDYSRLTTKDKVLQGGQP